MYKFLEANVSGYMTRNVKTVTRDVTMRELQRLFEQDDYNAFPVVDDSHAIGLVTKYDFLKCFAFKPVSMVPRYDDLMNRIVGDVMTPDFIYVHPEVKLTRVLQLMVDHQTRSVPVVNSDRRLLEIISREDIMRALADCTQGRH